MALRRWLIMIATALFLAVPAAAQEPDLDDKIESKEKELQRLRDQIKAERAKILEIERKAKNEAEYLRKLENEEKLTKELLAGLAEKEDMMQTQVERLRRDLSTNEQVYRRRLQIFSGRLREMYKEGKRRGWEELLGAEDFGDLLHRYKFMNLIAEQDAALIEDVRNRRAEIERQEAEITEVLHEVGMAKQEKEDELSRLEGNEEKRKGSLRSLESRKRSYEKNVEQLAKSENELQGLIEILEKQRVEQAREWGEYGETDFLEFKGRMKLPVEGETVRRFGSFKHPEFGTVTFNTGIDIDARDGAPVRAVARGRVEYASVLPGYGNCIILNHGGGYYTLYAHTAAILVEQGDQVERGTVIAETGEDASGAVNPLHFEIRKSKKALDPREWLE